MEEASPWSSHRTSPYKCDDDDSYPNGVSFPPGKRLAPVGANDEDEEEEEEEAAAAAGGERLSGAQPPDATLKDRDGGCSCSEDSSLKNKIQALEQDQEELNNSLMLMTSHFAKVQLRLQQTVGAPPEERERLLAELQQFAFRGIPDVKPVPKEDYNALETQTKKHSELITRLKEQLEELEGYAYESGEGSMPSNVLLERQRIVMEQLKARLNLNVDNIDKLNEDQLKAEVDEAVGQLVTPLKMKSHLVNQLKTQIDDLEMFVEFLQGEASTITPSECNDCGCNKHDAPETEARRRRTRFQARSKSQQEEIRRQTQGILERAMEVLHITTVAQFGCGGEGFRKNALKKTQKGNHYGDLRAKLELAVDKIIDTCSRVENTDCASATSETEEQLLTSPEVASLVRKQLAVAVRDLMHHGLAGIGGGTSSIVAPFIGCVSSKNVGAKGITHAWDVIMKFYEMKLGNEYNAAPARKLSQSFGLDLTGSAASARQTLLSAVFQINSTHSPYKRSADAKFKAFVCAGLNKRKLIPWLKLILRNQSILEQFYAPWGYVAKTGFEDSFKAIERLSICKFHLPVDVAVKQFQHMDEAF